MDSKEKEIIEYLEELEAADRGWDRVMVRVESFMENINNDNIEDYEDKLIKYFKKYSDYRFFKHNEMGGVTNIFMGLYEYVQKNGTDVFNEVEVQDYLVGAYSFGPYIFTCYSGQGVIFHIMKGDEYIFTS